MPDTVLNAFGNITEVSLGDASQLLALITAQVSGSTDLATEEADRAEAEADEAALAASAASAAANYFSSLAAGEAGTAAGELFSYPDGTGGIIYAERTGGGSTEIAHFMAFQAPTRSDLANISGAVNGETRLVIEDRHFGIFKFFSAFLYAATFGVAATVAVAADTAKGINVAPSVASGLATDGSDGVWARQWDGLIATFDWWDAVPGDYATGVSPDCLPAFNAMQGYFQAVRRNVSAPFVANGPKVAFPGAQYCFSDKVVLNMALELVPAGGTSGGETTMLRWTGGTGGIVINRGGSTYAGEVSALTGGGGSKVGPGFTIQGPGTNSTGNLQADLLYSAIRMKDFADIQGNTFRAWRGVGVCASASIADGVASPFYGNINGSNIVNNFFQNCKSGGIYNSGGDGNVQNIVNNRGDLCGRYGIFASPFLGGNFANNQFAHCGYPSASGVAEYSLVHHVGRLYQARYNATLAQLQGTTPGTDENIWWDIDASAGPTADFPQWTALLNCVPGGPYGGTGDFCGGSANYFETGAQLPDMPAFLSVGGFMGAGKAKINDLYAGVGGFFINAPFTRAKTYANASTASVRFGGTMSSVWFDLLGYQSSVATAFFDPQNFTSFAIEKATGDLGWKGTCSSPSFESGQTPVFRLTGPSTNMTYGGRSQAEARNVVEIKTLALGDGNNARFLNGGSGAPSSGYTAQGDIQFDRAAAAAGKAGYFTTTSGTIGSTAVVKQWGAIDA